MRMETHDITGLIDELASFKNNFEANVLLLKKVFFLNFIGLLTFIYFIFVMCYFELILLSIELLFTKQN